MLKLGILCAVAIGAAALLARRNDDGAPPPGVALPLLPIDRHDAAAEGRFAILTRGLFLDPYAYAGARTVH